LPGLHCNENLTEFTGQEGTGTLNAIETDTAHYIMRPDGIVLQTIKPGMRQELKDAQQNMAAFHKIAAGEKCLLLVDLRESGPTGPGVREFYAQNTVHITASAMLIGSSLSQMIGNFFINLNRPTVPCKLFTSEQAAVAWLKAHAVHGVSP
jgi:hypothetical protein